MCLPMANNQMQVHKSMSIKCRLIRSWQTNKYIKIARYVYFVVQLCNIAYV